MARKTSSTFYLRMERSTNGTAFAEVEMDISSFVNVLAGEVLRVKQVWFEWTSDDGGTINGTDVAASGAVAGASAFASLCSQSFTSVKGIVDNSTIAKNQIYVHIDATANIDFMHEDTGLNPVDFNDGFYVATDGIHLGVDQNTADSFANDIRISCLMECEIVKLSLSDAQAVLVSQTLG